MRLSFRLILITLAVSLLAACASPATKEGMTISPEAASKYDENTSLKGTVQVSDVTGGENTNPAWTSEIGNEEFQEALVESLRTAKLLASDTGDSQYQLSAKLMSVDQPMFGASLTVTTTVEYRLTDTKANREIWLKQIATPYTATMSDSLVAFERLRKANEGSARSNISALVDYLYKLDVSQGGVTL